MKNVHFLARPALFCGTLAALLTTVLVPTLAVRPALAHSAPCPYCNMTVSDATASVLRTGHKRIEYKCVYCALSQAQSEFPAGDLTVSAPSEKPGHPIVIKRTGGKWSASPASATFVSPAHIKHKMCQEQARAFTTKAAATKFAKTESGMVMSLAQMNAMAR